MRTIFLAALAVTSVASVVAYDERLAFEAMWRTKPCACAPARVMAWNCTPCTLMPFAPASDTYALHSASPLNAQFWVGYVAADDAVWLAFRGTEGLVEWLEDADFKLVPYPWCTAASPPVDNHTKWAGCRVHEGFLNVYSSVNETVFSHTYALLQRYPSASLRVDGHSLGAALATHAAVQLATSFSRPESPVAVTRLKSLHTIGSPRVGDPTFVGWASQLLFDAAGAVSVRLTHHDDIVPKLPLVEMGYLHLPHEVWYPHGHKETEPHWNASSPLVAHVVCADNATAEAWGQCSDSVPLQDAVPDDHMYLMGVHLSCNDGA